MTKRVWIQYCNSASGWTLKPAATLSPSSTAPAGAAFVANLSAVWLNRSNRRLKRLSHAQTLASPPPLQALSTLGARAKRCWATEREMGGSSGRSRPCCCRWRAASCWSASPSSACKAYCSSISASSSRTAAAKGPGASRRSRPCWVRRVTPAGLTSPQRSSGSSPA